MESASSKQAEPDEFVAIVSPLETIATRRLNGNGRGECLAAYLENADGFRQLATDAGGRGKNPCALLVRMVRDGDHRVSAAPREPNRCGCLHDECRYQDRCIVG